MCRPVTCRTCGKTTWAGCGQHVDQVMRDVAPAQRCTCERDAPSDSGGDSGGQARGAGLFSRLLGRGGGS
ncbi:hypothetical protein ACSL103130_07195 [Actinomyces slackii]|uniref:Uncharacterized protein n=1 Tax=Actinomyces slackii TaxID=52774 RepID=A0A448K902_9ACTO|nr:hypothetical protein [Actinomyces slackii]VEG73396.1 Uncharacterised protein [Actinomyces slackii]